jgi:tripartite-type tricarboxylate transporter receptor subunit TctC
MALFAAVAAEAAAQTYPQKPVRLVVPSGPSGSVDALARVLAQKLAEQWGQQTLVDNRPGAGGMIGVGAVAKSAADGYTLLMASNGNLATTQALYKNVPYDPVADFAPISLVATNPYVLVVHPSLPVKNVRGLVKLARAKPMAVNVASAGSAGTSHLAIELLNLLAGIKLLHVPYKTSQAALTSVASGETSVMFTGIVSGLPLISAHRIKALALAGDKRLALLPGVPTIAEDGVPGYEASNWTGVLAPAKTPSALIGFIHDAVRTALQAPEVAEHFRRQGSEIVASTPDYFRDFIKSEIAKWSRVVQEAGVKVE